jgi:uncharacterized protein YbbC (DUF1343 family)
MLIRYLFTFPALLLFSVLSCTDDKPETGVYESARERVTIGAEVLIDRYLGELQEKRIGLVMNPTARIGDVHMLDTLLALDVNVTALFAPEHGFRGEAGAGEIIEDGVDQDSGLPVFSLYGETRQPTPEMLEHVDMLIFDMQDVGARFYTYIATLGLVIESAAEAGLPVWILDRPNPAGGNYVSGWMLEEEFKSFVGPYPIPIAHGLTMGEMATMMVGERWIDFDTEPEIYVVEMDGWNRDMKWPETGLDWVPPSPNLPTYEHAYLYLGTVFYEGTTLSEGRGTNDPFLTMGDPSTQLSGEDLERLQNLTESLLIEPVEFTPVSIEGVAPSPKHEGEVCNGIKISALNYDFDPVITGLEIFSIIMNATSGYELRPFRYLLAGTREIDKLIDGEMQASDLNFELNEYLDQREPYLLY